LKEVSAMSEALKKVLIVEDNKNYQRTYESALNGRVHMLAALSISEAQELFAANPGINAIVMDACVPGDTPTTLIRKTFVGPMIAASSDRDYRQELVHPGCDHEVPKGHVPAKLIEVLSL
jgi:CheY-like chemotaxis protein